MRMIMGYNRSKTLNENIKMISEITGAGATPPDAGAGTAGAGTAGARTVKVYKVPSELKNVEDFQKWVISKGWGSELGPRGVDNRYGRYTAAAFAKHKDEYLKKPLADDEYTVAVDADPNDVLANTGPDGSNTNQNVNNPQGDADPNDLLSGK